MTGSPKGFYIEFPHEKQRELYFHELLRSSHLIEGRNLSLVDALLWCKR